MEYKRMEDFAKWSTEWDSDAKHNSLKASGVYNENNALADQYAGLEEDGGSRVDDGEGWRELAFDDPPKTADEYEDLVNKWSSAGYDVRAIDMDDGFAHSNIAVRPGGFTGEEEAVVPEQDNFNETVLSPQIQGAIERTSAYRDRAWSGQHAQDVYGKSNSLAEGNSLGIPVNDIRGGEPNTNQAMRAADSETARFFDPEKFKMDLKAGVQQTIRDKFG